MPYQQAVDLLRQPNTYYPTQLGLGLVTSATTTPDATSIVFGDHSSNANNAASAIAIGNNAGAYNQSTNSIAIGEFSAFTGQASDAIAIGFNAAKSNQGTNSIAIGTNAGFTGQGANSIAIGHNAGNLDQAANSIIINASNGTLNNTTADSIVVKPVRNATSANYLLYDATTGEITYNVAAPSSLRFKKNVVDMSPKFVDAIYNLKPVEFDFDEEHYNGKHALGLIAEDTYRYIPEVVAHNELDPSIIEGIDYDKLVVPLIKIAQDYKVAISDLQARVALLEA
jgi:hypothetical protein